MIVKKIWKRQTRGGLITTYYTGWFLFGFIPLYIIKVEDGGA